MNYIVYGPTGCGKTINKTLLATHLECSVIIDSALLKDIKTELTGGKEIVSDRTTVAAVKCGKVSQQKLFLTCETPPTALRCNVTVINFVDYKKAHPQLNWVPDYTLSGCELSAAITRLGYGNIKTFGNGDELIAEFSDQELIDIIINDNNRDMSAFIRECFMSDVDVGHSIAYKERIKHKLVLLLQELYDEL